MTYLWKMQRGLKTYRFQTDNREIHNKMKRREKFILVAEGVNCDLWIYQVQISRPDIARNILKSLCENEVKFDSKEELFYSEGISSAS